MLVLDVDGTMTDGKINVLDDGNQFKQFDCKDGLGIRMLLKQGIHVGIISHSSARDAIESRAKTLGIAYVYAGFEEKDVILEKWASELGILLSEVAYIGDDLNDLPVMSKVGFSACPADATDQVMESVDVILKNKGGDSCIREFIDKYLPVGYQKIA